jgi:hypothetical protein
MLFIQIMRHLLDFNQTLHVLRHTVWVPYKHYRYIFLHVSHIVLQFIVWHWSDVSTSNVYIIRVTAQV